MKKPAAVVGCVACMMLVVVACGQSLSTSDREDGVASKEAATTPGGFGPASGGAGDGAKGTDLEACATSSATARASKVFLVFMFDRSGSMAEGDRWASCRSATESFFGAKESVGMSASLHYFPVMGLLFPSCDVAKYAKPAVPMTTLPNGAFAQSLGSESPGGSTPTGPALAGAVKYAREIFFF